ncbi:MAG: hypothetical protein K2J20_02270 [Bacilli bacterium]|nr:hypothetical protein [Bacilli bacterium]
MEQNKYEIRIALQELRDSIDLRKKDWINRPYTNCYAYALGLDIPEKQICSYAYSPGVIGQSDVFLPKYRTYSYEQLINNMLMDFDALGIACREADTTDCVLDDEWKIALFLTGTHKEIIDFHFLREHQDGIWYHKAGKQGLVTNLDDYHQIIYNPQNCILLQRSYDRCFTLTLKRN